MFGKPVLKQVILFFTVLSGYAIGTEMTYFPLSNSEFTICNLLLKTESRVHDIMAKFIAGSEVISHAQSLH